ncbi:hypothetical protein [Streptomyces noursei]|uniref:hypothetical protein n=1 Tax=Streptomyces noursei TaxID=1971 RepID=UPI001965527D|nr:hypothetical protein [Streptomyces noursei]QRX93448.1 hypothetical protein JNO44_23615 [Streptomyces noursei]
MELVGFFREMEPNNAEVYKESITNAYGRGGGYETALVSTYLRSGYPILDVTESTVDAINGSFRVPGGSSILTDGRFVWREDLATYVDRYSLSLPDSFLDYIRENNFKVPNVAHGHILELSLSVGELLGFRTDSGAGPRNAT